MSEPEDILLDGAHHATVFVRRLWQRNARPEEPASVRLIDVRSRLELFLRAAFGLSLRIGVAEAPAVPSLFARLGKRIPGHLIERRTLSSTDGEWIRLPREIPDAGGGMEAYRLFAAQLAGRVARGTHQFLPKDLLERDLYLVREALQVDRLLAAELPGLQMKLARARLAAAAERPAHALLTPIEARVEDHVRDVLTGALGHNGATGTPEESLDWAIGAASRARVLGGRYRGIAGIALWGVVLAPAQGSRRQVDAGSTDDEAPAMKLRVSTMRRRPRVRMADEDEDDRKAGMWMIQLDDPQEHVEDPMGLQRPTDREEEADPDDLADSLSELPEARLVARPGRPREILTSDDPPTPGVVESRPISVTDGLSYPEWDYRTSRYRLPGATVRERPAPLGNLAWAEGVLLRRAALRHEVRRRFERLRPRRMRVGRQVEGAEVDIAAYVDARASQMAGCGADDRLYEAIRSARRDVAITLLVDVSASTDAWVTGDLRVVDVEKEALLIVCDALDALGDPYAILAFSGEGPEHVSILPLKSFEERSGGLVYRRIAALEPDRYTRMGAAIRHATASMMHRSARHRLLLVLSDGKPNDVDRYEGRYGVEDARQAVAESRLQGLHPFCVTVDRHAPAYMPRIFGAGGYAALHHPEHLPTVLVDVLRRLVKA